MSEDYFTMKLFLYLKIGTLDQAKTYVPRKDLQILNRIFNAEWESMLWGRVLGETVRQEEEKKNERYWCWRWSLRKEKVHPQKEDQCGSVAQCGSVTQQFGVQIPVRETYFLEKREWHNC